MPDIITPLNESAKNSRKIASSLAVTRLVVPEATRIDSSDSPYNLLPLNLRSVSFLLTGIDGSNTVEFTFPNSSIIFDDAKYDKLSFSYALDLPRDCQLSNEITIEIVGSATVDIFYTWTTSINS